MTASAPGAAVEYFFTLSSPWAYLGHARFVELAARLGVAIRYRPMPVRRVFDETGGLPLPRRHPVRQRYRLVELQRWRRHRDLPLNLQPKFVPFDATFADRVVIALVGAGLDPDPFVRRAFAGIWAEDRDFANLLVVESDLRASGYSADAVISAARSDAAARAHEDNFRAALQIGVFGAPSYVLGGEVFWGQDRLDLLEEALATGRPPFRPVDVS